ncbi:MAG: DUF3540 domain-containing protein [Polyangiaceae bacterium]|nr:DUF3540 domain-containing protein [Polyangiaceae bacterium]
MSLAFKLVDAERRGEAGLYLGPAQVLEVSADHVVVSTPGGAARATLALGYSYEPQVGDDVLAIGRDASTYWVIGVVRSTGKAVMAFPGDLELRANGRISINAEQGVAIASPDVEIRSGKLRIFAGAVLQHVESLAQRVRELYTLHAGQSQTVVEGTILSQSKRAKIVTEETVSVNGREIHLG